MSVLYAHDAFDRLYFADARHPGDTQMSAGAAAVAARQITGGVTVANLLSFAGFLGSQQDGKTMLKKWLIWALLAVLGLSACGQAEDTHPGQPVTKRKVIFKTILRTLEPMGLVVRGHNEYNAAQFRAAAARLQELSTQPWQYFTPGSNYPPTRAKPDVWAKPAEFKQAQQKFITAAAGLNQAAQSNNLDTIRPAFAAVESSCKSCHQQFRGIPH